jgi:hypothetical protein
MRPRSGQSKTMGKLDAWGVQTSSMSRLLRWKWKSEKRIVTGTPNSELRLPTRLIEEPARVHRTTRRSRQRNQRGPMPRYKCKGIAALDIALSGLPAKMRVEADAGTGVSAKTVGELRKMTTWSENLVITTPQERHPESAVKISKASAATRTSPKP